MLLILMAYGCSFRAEAQETSEKPRIELKQSSQGASSFVVVGLNKATLAVLERQGPAGTLDDTFAVYAGAGDIAGRNPMLGETRVEGGVLVFTPRFPLEAGLPYQAILRLEGKLANSSDSQTISKIFTLKRGTTSAARVQHIFPTTDTVPENLLKFYLHFSHPMSRGEAYRHVRLMETSGKSVDDPFLELGEELWDSSGTRFTLLFDPGRIKRGLKPREEIGPALEEGKSYTLIISAKWPDAQGQPLASDFRKTFQVISPDDDQPRTSNWRLSPPKVQTRDPLELRFPESLDHAMLQRVLRVVDSNGASVPGAVHVSQAETHWRFIPQQDWDAGEYVLRIDSALEDLAGNSIRRPFEVDMTRPVTQHEDVLYSEIRFQIASERDPP